MKRCYDDQRALLGHNPGHLTLRIRGTDRDGQLLRIKSDRCSVGSHPDCTIRLRGKGVQPVHCLILRGEAGTAIRRWSPDTRLNGHVFDDSWLSDGDRLSVGPIEFDVVGCDSTTDDQLTSPVDDQQQEKQPDESSAMQDQLEAEKAALAERLADVEEELGQLRDLAVEIGETKEREQLWATERSHLEQQLDELQQLVSDRDDFVQQVITLEAEKVQWHDETQSLKKELDQRAAESKAAEVAREESQRERLQFSEERQTFDREREQWEEQRQQWERQLAQDLEELKAQQHQLSEEQKQLESASMNEFESNTVSEPSENKYSDSTDSSDITTSEEISPGRLSDAPQNVASVLANLGHTQVWEPKTEDPESEGSIRNQQTPVSEPESGFLDVAADPPQSEVSDEDSIEEYMARLLHGVRGNKTQSADGVTHEVPNTEPEPVVEQSVAPEPVLTNEEFSPRSQAPEQQSSLAAMREVANETTQQALETNYRSRKKAAVVGKAIIAVISLVAGGILFNIRESSPVALYSSIASFAVSLFFLIQVIALFQDNSIGTKKK